MSAFILLANNSYRLLLFNPVWVKFCFSCSWTYYVAIIYIIMNKRKSKTDAHCVKRVQIHSYFWFIFFCIWTEYRKIQTRNNSIFGQFSRSGCLQEIFPLMITLKNFIHCSLLIYLKIVYFFNGILSCARCLW